MDDISGLEGLTIGLEGASRDLLARATKAKTPPVSTKIIDGDACCRPTDAHKPLKDLDSKSSHFTIGDGEVQPCTSPHCCPTLSTRAIAADDHRPLTATLIEGAKRLPSRACGFTAAIVAVQCLPLKIPEGILKARFVPFKDPQHVLFRALEFKFHGLTQKLMLPLNLLRLQLLEHLTLKLALVQIGDLSQLLFQLEFLSLQTVKLFSCFPPRSVQEIELVQPAIDAKGVAVEVALDPAKSLAKGLQVLVDDAGYSAQSPPRDGRSLLLFQTAVGNSKWCAVAQHCTIPALAIGLDCCLWLLREAGAPSFRLGLLASHHSTLVVVDGGDRAGKVVSPATSTCPEET
mmetsp:Transcript_30446/g.70796  ORF Transcript_30446/g.70796 Transcript_30446/m.70796 type:complete len:346 (-) Transcript_30446:533-1570(-)